MMNNIFNGPVERAYLSSVDQSINSFTITLPNLHDIDRISEGNPELQAAAQEVRNAHPQSATALEKFQKWASLLNSVEGLTEKVHQHYPQIVALISNLTHWAK